VRLDYVGVALELLHSKRQVNRAGKCLRELRVALRENDAKALEELGSSRITASFAIVEWWRGLHARPLAQVNANLRYYIRKAGAEQDVTQRLKRFTTIVHKLEREPTMALTNMEDIGGVRAILPTQEHVVAVCEMLDKADRWNLRRQRFYIDGGEPGPKSDGYRAVHLIIDKGGFYVEIQLRTPRQDSWAQSVEQDTRRLRADLKFGSGPDDLREYYILVSEYFAMLERMIEPSEEFMEELAKHYAAVRQYFPGPGDPR
jgi:putative GTP pyrophosphokinase